MVRVWPRTTTKCNVRTIAGNGGKIVWCSARAVVCL